MIAYVAGLPAYIKTSAKLVLAAPFAFHGWNGVRHLAWDMGKCKCTLCLFIYLLFVCFVGLSFCFVVMNVKGAYRTGYAVLGATVLSTVYLVWF